jgi:hypothetical protein
MILSVNLVLYNPVYIILVLIKLVRILDTSCIIAPMPFILSFVILSVLLILSNVCPLDPVKSYMSPWSCQLLCAVDPVKSCMSCWSSQILYAPLILLNHACPVNPVKSCMPRWFY